MNRCFARWWIVKNGQFGFQRRFARTDFPLTLAVSAPGLPGATRTILVTEAGFPTTLQLRPAPVSQFTTYIGGKYHVEVTSGPRAAHVVQQGACVYTKYPGGAAILRLNYDSGEYDELVLTFNTSTNGTFEGSQTYGLSAPDLALGTFTSSPDVEVFAPTNLSGRAYRFSNFVMTFGDTGYNVKHESGNLLVAGEYRVVERNGNFIRVEFIDRGQIQGGATLTFRAAGIGILSYDLAPGNNTTGQFAEWTLPAVRWRFR